ncbi:hypothetical protein VCHA35O135_260050 [Vibrio chagasii]|nr:hypothetical protein VCHA35O135_260050 [Vibrio chagasii]
MLMNYETSKLYKNFLLKITVTYFIRHISKFLILSYCKL